MPRGKWPWVTASGPQQMLHMRPACLMACLMGPALELGPGTSVVPFYLKAPWFMLAWHFTVYLKARGLDVVSTVASDFRQKPRVSSSVWGWSRCVPLSCRWKDTSFYFEHASQQCCSMYQNHLEAEKAQTATPTPRISDS